MIAVGGFYPASKNPSFDSVFPIAASLPTLHVMGRGDVVVPPERSQTLVDACENARVEYHDGGESNSALQKRGIGGLMLGTGHFTPSKASWRHFFK